VPQVPLDDAAGKLVASDETVTIPARTILVAAGTQPNTVLAREDDRNVVVDGRYFQAYDEEGNRVKPERSAKPKAVQVLMSHRDDGRAISFLATCTFLLRNVVKAMASAKQGYPVVSRSLAAARPRRPRRQRSPPNSTMSCAPWWKM